MGGTGTTATVGAMAGARKGAERGAGVRSSGGIATQRRKGDLVPKRLDTGAAVARRRPMGAKLPRTRRSAGR